MELHTLTNSYHASMTRFEAFMTIIVNPINS